MGLSPSMVKKMENVSERFQRVFKKISRSSQRGLVHIGQIVEDPFVEIGLGMGLHLPEAGHPRPHGQPGIPPPGAEPHLLDGQRPRAHQAHLPFQDVPELGQFIQIGIPQELAQPGDARVMGDLEHRPVGFVQVANPALDVFSLLHHGAELIHLESDAIFAATHLAEDGPTRRLDLMAREIAKNTGAVIIRIKVETIRSISLLMVK